MMPTSPRREKRNAGSGERFHVIMIELEATPQTKYRAEEALVLSRSMMPRPQPAWQSLRAAKLESARTSTYSSSTIHSTIVTITVEPSIVRSVHECVRVSCENKPFKPLGKRSGTPGVNQGPRSSTGSLSRAIEGRGVQRVEMART